MPHTLMEPHEKNKRRRKPTKTKAKPAIEATMTKADEEKSTDRPWLKEYMLSLCR